VVPDRALVQAWQDFYSIHSEVIRRFGRSRGIPVADLDDCVQEVWATVIAELLDFDYQPDRGQFRSWLYAVVRSKAADFMRDRARARTCRFDVAREEDYELYSRDPDPARSLELRCERQMIHAVLRELRTVTSHLSYRVFFMRRIQERTVQVVAASNGLSSDQVRARQHRVQKRFRGLYRRYAGHDFGAANDAD